MKNRIVFDQLVAINIIVKEGRPQCMYTVHTCTARDGNNFNEKVCGLNLPAVASNFGKYADFQAEVSRLLLTSRHTLTYTHTFTNVTLV